MSTMTASADGYCNYPLQPAFLGWQSASKTSVTGNGTVYTVVLDSEEFDQGSDYDGTTFTAPVTGRFHLKANIGTVNMTTSFTDGYITITTSNRTYTCSRINVGQVTRTIGQTFAFVALVLADMDSGDTAEVKLKISGSTKSVNLSTGTSIARCSFSGDLIA